MKKPKVTENKAENVETKPRTEESILNERLGKLEFERKAIAGMLQQVDAKTSPIIQRLIAIKQAKQ